MTMAEDEELSGVIGEVDALLGIQPPPTMSTEKRINVTDDFMGTSQSADTRRPSLHSKELRCGH